MNELQLIIGNPNADKATGWTGWKGYSFMQAGYIYKPFMPLYLTPIQMTTVNFDIPQLVIGRKL